MFFDLAKPVMRQSPVILATTQTGLQAVACTIMPRIRVIAQINAQRYWHPTHMPTPHV
jgi:hypothetical protein